ncbi:single-stranded DNA-binding protein [Corynebacterium aquatimens]|uniref:single-stranded DNA-binding protein n=1 Tax=Corynebacterium aquatimens TaxID=1190508 RepID=UPI00253F7CC5|nr:single-stranded DNA-binding protein [Corynebacterium aquatimens]
MAQGDTPITVVGNLVADPELRFIPSGAAVANFRIASTPRSFNRETNQWEDGEALFLTCNCWRQMAENVAETLTKGMRVIVNGRLKQRSYQTREGESRTVFEIEVEEVGPSLKYATATVNRTPREGGGTTAAVASATRAARAALTSRVARAARAARVVSTRARTSRRATRAGLTPSPSSPRAGLAARARTSSLTMIRGIPHLPPVVSAGWTMSLRSKADKNPHRNFHN